MQSFELQVLTAVLSLFVTGIGALIAAYVPKLKAIVDKHLTSKQADVAKTVIDGLSSIVQTVVADFDQRVVSDAKKNGVFTPELAANVKDAAVKAVIAQAPNLIALGQTAIGDVQALIPQLVEQAVAKAK